MRMDGVIAFSRCRSVSEPGQACQRGWIDMDRQTFVDVAQQGRNSRQSERIDRGGGGAEGRKREHGQSLGTGRRRRKRTVKDGAFLDTELAHARSKAEEREADDIREERHDGGSGDSHRCAVDVDSGCCACTD